MMLLRAYAHERKRRKCLQRQATSRGRDLQSKRSCNPAKNTGTMVAPQGSSKLHEVAGGGGCAVNSEQRNLIAGGSITGVATGTSEGSG
jgi:hypothetical protein